VADVFWSKADLADAITFQLKKQTIPLMKAELRYAQFGQEGKHIPGTDTIRFIKKAAVSELGSVAAYQLNADEVTSPDAEKLAATSKVDITSTPYGRVFGFTRREASYDPLDMVQHAKSELAYDAARLMDTIVRDELGTSGTVVYANGRASRITVVAGDNLKSSDIRKFAPKLRSLDVPFREGELMAVTHPVIAYDIMSDTTTPGGWQNASLYAGSSQLFRGELGQVAGTRFVTTTRCKKFAGAGGGGIDVYATVVGVGEWCIGKASVEALRFTAVPPIPSAGDKLGLKWFIGFAVDFGTKILDGTRYLRVESAMSTL
jgi:N4-gp56 family major capsid protein